MGMKKDGDENDESRRVNHNFYFFLSFFSLSVKIVSMNEKRCELRKNENTIEMKCEKDDEC